ncbi:hypothetical protein C2G38_2249063 [Gigaspora rosea]|uniref:Uncharacterized protein n=1 Tax=Gigaspora rosea TaxID=44941 RepID=A0A397UTX8_9GLOM|nr:hypothetical protein C2G38_2249063 [Gigaspora rosea]
MIKKWLAILHSQYKHYFGDNMWAYEESMKQVMQDRAYYYKYAGVSAKRKRKNPQNFSQSSTTMKKKKELINSQHKPKINNNDKIDVINTDTDDNDSDDQRNYEENRNILNNVTRLDDNTTNSNNDNLSLSNSDNDFFITKKTSTKKIGNIMSKSKNSNPEKDNQITIDSNFHILKEQNVNKIVATKLGDIRNENTLEYNENDRPSNHTRSQKKNRRIF